MNSGWRLKSVLQLLLARCVVWKGAIQLPRFSAGNSYAGMGLPCMWRCNFDNDPRRDPAVAEYVRHVSYVVEIRDRPSEDCWGKLYEARAEDVVDEWMRWWKQIAWQVPLGTQAK